MKYANVCIHLLTHPGKYIKNPSKDMADPSNKDGGERVGGRLCTVCPIVAPILNHGNAFLICQMHEK